MCRGKKTSLPKPSSHPRFGSWAMRHTPVYCIGAREEETCRKSAISTCQAGWPRMAPWWRWAWFIFAEKGASLPILQTFLYVSSSKRGVVATSPTWMFNHSPEAALRWCKHRISAVSLSSRKDHQRCAWKRKQGKGLNGEGIDINKNLPYSSYMV